MEKDGYALVMEQAEQKADKILKESKEQAEIVDKARKQAVKDLDLLETKQLMVEMEVEEQEQKAAEAAQNAERARQEEALAQQRKAQAQAAEAAIREQARYDAEITVRQLQAELFEKESLIHNLLAETEKLKTMVARLKEYLQEKSIIENFLSWIRGRSQQPEQEIDERER